MSVLDSVIRYKALEKAEEQANRQTMTNILGTFQKARQTTMLLDMEKKKLDASLATKGLRFGPEGKIEGDPGIIESLGLAKPKEWKPTTREDALSYESAKAGIKEEGTKPTQTERKIVGILRGMKEKNRPLSEIHKYIEGKGYEPADFSEELKDYSPIDKATFLEKITGRQKLDRRVKGGKTYEKRKDGLWHPID